MYEKILSVDLHRKYEYLADVDENVRDRAIRDKICGVVYAKIHYLFFRFRNFCLTLIIACIYLDLLAFRSTRC